jgi:hypothetical protein
MQKSQLIKRLSKEIEKYGDSNLLSVKIVELEGGWESYLTSPTREKDGYSVRMNYKELKKYCEENPIKEVK